MKTGTLQEDAIYIVGAGAQTPVGRSAPATAAAVRCHLSAYAEHPFMFDGRGEPMIVARAQWLDETFPLVDRIVTLAVDAAQEALRPLGARAFTLLRQMRVHLALADETVPNAEQRREILDRVGAGAGLTAADPAVAPVVDGHAGGLLALENAVRQLRQGEAPLCLVGGADSWLSPELLDTLDRAGHLRSPEHRWGFTPGEGAGFCLLTTGASARRLGLPPLAELVSVATARENKLKGTRTICLGEGLTAAFRRVLDPRLRVTHSYCDFNGETYRADEYGFAICRTSECFENASSFTAAADCWGDVGAASGPLALALPIVAWSRGYARGSINLVWSSSAGSPLRAAALLKDATRPD